MIDFIPDQEHEVTEILAYQLWEKRGRPFGSPEIDWFEAKYQLATGLAQDSVVTCLQLATISQERITNVIGRLSPTMLVKLSDCLKTGLEIR